MKTIFERQKAAYNQAPYPALEQRKQQLRPLKASLLNNEQRISEAISKDFGYRNHNETRFLELMTSVGDINFALEHIRSWTQPEKRAVALQFQPASNTIEYQPLGLSALSCLGTTHFIWL